MNDRQRFLATMRYQPRDRAFITDFGFWGETLARWRGEGLPDNVDPRTFFGMDRWDAVAGTTAGLMPLFAEVVLEDRGDHEVAQQGDGVRVLRKKFMGSIPVHENHLLVDRASWRKHYKPRLDPSDPGRYPKDWDARVKIWRDPDRDFVLQLGGDWLGTASLYGWLRNWMGVENLSMVVYDDPAWFEEMVETLTDCAMGVAQKCLETGGRFDAFGFWEDMCYSGGPLLSPEHFRKFLVPQCRRITGLLRRHGVDIIYVDSDGKADDLIPLWLEAGVNCLVPVEVGTWGADPVHYRQRFGRDLLVMGGFDKRILQRTTGEIESEIRRLTPMVEEGGYIPFCDHLIPPDVPLGNYLFYLDSARKLWGRNANLKPMGKLPGASRPVGTTHSNRGQ